MPGHDVDFVAFDLACEDNRGLALDDALPQPRAHPLGVIGVEVQLAGDLLVGEVQPQEIQAQDPDAQGLMVAGEDGPGQVIEPPGAGPTVIAPPSGLGLITALLRDPVGVTAGAVDPLGPPQVADDLEAARVIDQGLNVEHLWSESVLAAELTRLGCDIVTGGGPGLMQAANKGARMAGADPDRSSVGIRVDLPFEQEVDPFVGQVFERWAARGRCRSTAAAPGRGTPRALSGNVPSPATIAPNRGGEHETGELYD